MTTRRRSLPRRGMALMLVMVAIGLAAVMATAVLASASLRAQLAGVGHERLQRQYLAASGLNLAMYYIEHPKESPVALVYGQWGSVHYPGESNLTFPTVPGTLSITVTNTAADTLQIVAVADTGGQIATAKATVNIQKSRTFEYATLNRGDLALGSKSKVVGGLFTDGVVSMSTTGQVTGTIVAANGGSLGGRSPSATESADYPISSLAYAPTYFYNGKKCTAKTLPKNVPIIFLPDFDLTNNPANVWYATQDSTFAYPLSMAGTVITAPGVSLTFGQSVTISPYANMPALVVDKNVTISADNRTVRCNGVTYVGGQLRGNAGSQNSYFRVHGAFLSGQSGWPVHPSFRSNLHLERNAGDAKVKGFADELEKIDKLSITSWSITNGTP